MRVVDKTFVYSDEADVALLKGLMAGINSIDFEDIRGAVAKFADLEDGEIAQIAQDAGFDIQE